MQLQQVAREAREVAVMLSAAADRGRAPAASSALRFPWRRLAHLAARAVLTLGAAAAFAADPQIAVFSDAPDPVPAGGNVTYSARIDNSALDAATGVTATVPVPAGTTFVSATAPCALAGANVECALGTVGANGTDVRTLDFVFKALGPGPATVSATATLTADNDVNPANNAQTQTTTVIQGGDLSLAKSGAPDPVVGGANLTYTLSVGNAGPNASAAIVVTDNLPPSVTFVSAGGSGWSCSQSAGTVTCTHAGTHAAGSTLPALTIVGRVTAAGGTVTNSASVAPASGGTADPDTTNNTATVDTTVTPGADASITKVVASAVPAIAGSNVTFQLQPRNGGPATAVNAVVTDTLPAGFTFVSAAGPNWSCSAAGATITCTRASLPTSATDNITVVATAPPTASVGATGTTYTNTATIASNTADPAPGNNTGSAGVLVLPDGADLRLAKTKTPNPVARGSNLTSTIVVTNGGPRRATGTLRVIEQLSGESFVSASGSGWSCSVAGTSGNTQTLVCDHANAAGLNVGASLPTLVLTTLAAQAGTVSNMACTGSSVPAGALGGAVASPPAEGDANPTNDCSGVVNSSSTIIQPDLAIAKTTSTPTGGDKTVSASEGSVTYTLVVSNVSAGSDAATGIRITDTVPAFIAGRTTISAVTATASAGTATFNCTVSSATVTCVQSGGALAPGQTVTVPITVNRALAAAAPFSDYTNTASVTNTVEGDPNPANNSASDTVRIEPIADVEVAGKTVTPASVHAGETATYVVSYRNNGPSAAEGVALADVFTFAAGDPGATVLSIASSKGSCSIAAGATLNAATPGYTCTIGTLANGETQSVTLAVRPNFQAGDPARSFANTASLTTTTPENTAGGDNGNNSRSATLAVTASLADLLSNKTDFEDPVLFAGNAFLNYRVTVTNNGPSFTTGVRIDETMTPPAGKRIRFVCDTAGASSAVCNAPSLCTAVNVTSAAGAAVAFSCSVPAGNATTGAAIGQLAATQSKSVFLRFEALDAPQASGDIYNNTALAVANEADGFPANNASDEQTTVRQRIDLAVAKSASAATVTLRQPFVWNVAVTNNGPGNSVQTDVGDTLPAGVAVTGTITFTKTSPAGSGTCSLTGSVVACALGALNSGGTATIAIPVRIETFPAGSTLANTASVDTDPAKIGGIDPVPANNSATSTVTVTRSSLTGTVFQDRDRAGANAGAPQSPAAEPRIAGVAVRLTGTDLYGNAVDVTATSDAAGIYTFASLPPSNAAGYTLTETQPAGFTNSPAAPPAPSAGGTYSAGGASGNSGFAGIVLGGAVAATGYDFPELRLSSIGGFVYVDANLNGVRDAGTDLAVAGATVRLLNAGSGATLATTTTDATGVYNFTGLDASVVYTLEEPLPASPAGLQNGPVTPGQIGGAACAAGCTAQPNTPAVGTDRIAAIDLSAGDATGFNFGERQSTFVSGLVYVDANRNNALDGSDTARLPGVTLRLVQGADCTAGTTLQTQTSAADGTFRFDNVLAFQNYLVCETQPAGYGTGNAKGVAGSNVAAIANLPAAGTADNTFGETPASVAGAVYQDFSAGAPAATDNGARDAGELGISGVTVTLTGRDITGAAVSASAVTDASGAWRIDGLLQSDATGYTVIEGAIPPSSGVYNDGKDTAGSAGGSTAVNDRFGGVVLGAGVQASGYLFGELPIAPIAGTVYLDRNRSGTLDPAPTDGRLAGVVLTLRAGLVCAGPALQTTTTDAAGAYSFSGVSAGLPYTLCETQPAGYADGGVNPGAGATSGAADSITIASLPAGGSAGNQFGERAGSLAGTVFLDANNDGLRAAGDTGLNSVTVTLTGTTAAGAAVNRTATTDAVGAWRFDDLPASGTGGYTVTEQAAQPLAAGNATLNGRTTAGSAGGTATPVAAVPSAIAGIALAAGADATEYNFAEILPSSLAGTVFIDLNNDGVRNAPGDAGLNGVTITLAGTDDTGAAVGRSTTTGVDGRYAFAGLRPGTYALTEPAQPANTSNGLTVAGSAGGSATAPGTTPSAVGGIALSAPGTAASGYDFAELAASATIAGRVWLDANDSGTLDGAEAGIAGVTVTLAGTDLGGAAITRSTVTDATGAYAFANLTPGNYTVREPAQPAGTLNGRTVAGSSGGMPTSPATVPSAVTGIALGVGQNVAGVDFGELAAAALSGRVYADNNDNGRVDSGEGGLAGVTIRLTGSDDLGAAVALTATTDAAGAYAFPGLRPGRYALTEPAQPAGTVNGITSAGTSGGSATSPSVAPSAITSIVLAPGAQGTDYNFGEIGSSPDLVVAKTAVEARFTVANPGNYAIRVKNAGSVPTRAPYTVTDRLPAGLTLDGTPAGAGWTCTGAAGASAFSCTSAEPLAAGAANGNAIAVRVRVGAAALAASPAVNAVLVEGGGEIDARAPLAGERDAFNANPATLPACDPAILHNACRQSTTVQAAASVSGTVWSDVGSARGVLDAGDRRLKGWQVEVVDPASGTIVARTATADDGTYRIADLLPGVPLAVRFRDPQSAVVFGYPVNGETAPGSSGAACDPTAAIATGSASSCPGSGANPALTVVLAAGQNLPQQSLPVDPSGVIYDSGTRQPVPGAVVTLAPVGACPGWNPANGLVAATLGGYVVDGSAVSMTVGADGYYQFLFAPSAPPSCTFGIAVVPPAGYRFASTLIPPAAGPLAPPGGPGSTFAVQPQAGPPTGAVGPATTYYVTFAGGSAAANVIHNHLPLDADTPAGLSLSKTGDKAQAEVGDSVRYTVTVQKTAGAAPLQTTVVDRLPAGFTFIAGTATVGGVAAADPLGKPGPTLTFQLGAMPASGQLVLQYRLRVGVGAQQGDGTNRARGYACNVPAGCVGADGATPLPVASASNEGRHRVRVMGGVFTTDVCVMGKIYVDCNGNHIQDAEELGIPGVRLVFSDGTFLVSDSEGKYSHCGLPPRSAVLKVDGLTLPRGSRLTTTSNRNLGDAGSLWLDLKNGELHRADFAEGSCSNTVLEQVKARRAQGEVRSVETERKRGPALRFDSKAHGLDALSSPRQGTDSARQQVPKARDVSDVAPTGGSDAAR